MWGTGPIITNGKLSEKLTSVNMLARKLGLTVKQLYFISYNLEKFYTVYQIPKKNEKFRTIEAPSPLLKKIQSKILQVFISQRTSRAATAFEKKRNIKQNAQIHLNQPVLIGLDVKNFFHLLDSIKYGTISKNRMLKMNLQDSLRCFALLTDISGCIKQGA